MGFFFGAFISDSIYKIVFILVYFDLSVKLTHLCFLSHIASSYIFSYFPLQRHQRL